MAMINMANTAAMTIPAIGPASRCVSETDLLSGRLDPAIAVAAIEAAAIDFELVEDADAVLADVPEVPVTVTGPTPNSDVVDPLEVEPEEEYVNMFGETVEGIELDEVDKELRDYEKHKLLTTKRGQQMCVTLPLSTGMQPLLCSHLGTTRS